MATTLYMRNTAGAQGHSGWIYSTLSEQGGGGTGGGTWPNGLEDHANSHNQGLEQSRGASASTLATKAISTWTSGMHYNAFISDIVKTAFTMSGSIEINVWMLESVATINAKFSCCICKLDRFGVPSLVGKVIAAGELGTSFAAVTLTLSGYSSVNFERGDRIIVACGVDPTTGTMGAGNIQMQVNGPTGGAAGDCYVTFTETITFFDCAGNGSNGTEPFTGSDAPAGSRLFLLNSASEVIDGAREVLEMGFGSGASASSAEMDTPAGPVSPPLMLTRNTTSDVPIEWFSRPLKAFTLTGLAIGRMQIGEVSAGGSDSRGATLAEIARVDNDGSNPTVWSAQIPGMDGFDIAYWFEEAGAASNARVWLAGPDLVFTDGQRIRLRLYMVDNYAVGQYAPMSSGFTSKTWFNAPLSTDVGYTYIILPQTVEQFAGILRPDGTVAAGGFGTNPHINLGDNNTGTVVSGTTA